MSFKDLKKQSKLGSLTAKLVKEVEKMNNTGGNTDDRIWKLDVIKAVTVMLLSDFLPAPEGEDLPFVKLYSHAFQGPVDGSLRTLSPLLDRKTQFPSITHYSGTMVLTQEKETARKQKRKLTYVLTSML